MKLIDTHAHLQFKAYDPDRDEVVKRNSEQLKAVINVGSSIATSEGGAKLAEKIDNFYAAVAIHPHHFDHWYKNSYSQLENLGKNKKVVAVGEIGLDKHSYQGSPKPDLAVQAKMLHQQIDLARKLKVPVILHCREAYDELYKEIQQYKGRLTGVVHCFMGTKNQAKKFLDLGLHISFTGNITYKKNNNLREIAKMIPNNKILTETDAPYLPPEPYRGKRNEPIYVKMVAVTLAGVKGWGLQETIGITAQNAKELFNIP